MRLFLRFFICLAGIVAVVQQTHAQRDWTVPFRAEQVFIENQGQFDAAAEGEAALYGIDHGFGWQVLMDRSGARLISRKGERPHEAYEMAEEMKPQTTVIAQEWIGTHPDMQILPLDERSDYFTYSYETASAFENRDHVPAFRALRYAQIYPGIDLLYEAPEEGGLKYSLHLAPGADPNQILLRYSGSTVQLDGNGNLRLATVLGDLVDHAPEAHYGDGQHEAIPCAFQLQGSDVRFALGNYDPSRPLIIDPWTINPGLPAPFNRAFEVDADAAGNVYVFGGGMGYNLKKYNSAGTLQWTHVSPWDTSNAWFGELLVMPAGDVFITSGSAAKIRRLTTAGSTVWTNNGPFFNVDEYWTLSLNCDNTHLLSGGTRIISLTSPQGHLFDINMSNGSQLAGSPVNIAPSGMNEIRGLCRSSSGPLFAMSNNNIISLNPITYAINYTIAGYSLPYNSPAYRANSVQGVNAIDANTNFLYTSNGASVDRRTPSTGAVVGSASIPGGGFTGGFFGSGATNSGLVLDDCGNLYVGSSNQVLKYNASLAQQATIATTGAVYDVVVAPGNVVIWGGNGFVTSNTTLAPCVPKVVVCPPLAVEMSGLAVNCKNGAAELSWLSTIETESVVYTVEHSHNAALWEPIGNVEGQSEGGGAYRFAVSDPRPGWYYRLHTTDAQGHSSYTTVATMPDCEAATAPLTAWPNPTEGRMQLSFHASASQPYHLQVFSLLGERVMEREIAANEGWQQIELSLAGLSDGLYTLSIQSKGNVAEAFSTRVIKR